MHPPSPAPPPPSSLDAALALAHRRDRRAAALALAAREPEGAVAALARRLDDPARRRAALDALGWIQTDASRASLARAIEDPALGLLAIRILSHDPGAVSVLLRAYGRAPRGALEERRFEAVRNAIVLALARMGAPALDAMLRQGSSAGESATRDRLVVARGVGPAAFDQIAGFLGDSKSERVLGAARVLREMGDVRAIPLLLPLLTHRRLRVSQVVYGALARLGRAYPGALLRALEERGEALTPRGLWLRAEAREGSVFPALVAWANAPAERHPGSGAEALGVLGDVRAVPHLIALLDAPLTRAKAATALGCLGDPAAIEPLVAALDHRTVEVGWALRRLGRPAGIRALEAARSAPDVRAHAGIIDHRSDPETFFEALGHPRFEIRRQAAGWARFHLRDERVAGRLADLVRSDTDWVTRRESASELGWAPRATAEPALLAALCDVEERVRVAASSALARLRGERR